MAERLPLAIVGLLDPWVGVRDFLLATFPAGCLVSRVDLDVQDAPAGGPCTVEVRNATGGGGQGIAVTIADGQTSGSATGALAVAAGGSLYARVTASNGAENARGSVTNDAVAQVVTGPELATLARLKDEAGIADTAHDVQLTNLLHGVSQKFATYCRRPIAAAGVTEVLSGDGWTPHLLLRYPAEAVSVVEENGLALAVDVGFAFDAGSRILWRLATSSWASGKRNVRVTYTAGYASIPEDLVEAAIAQTRHEFHQIRPSGQNRLGLAGQVLDSGGVAGYVPYGLLNGVREVLDHYRSVW